MAGQTDATENNCNFFFFLSFQFVRVGFLKIHGVFKYSYRDRKSRASLSLSYKYFCSTLLLQLLENLIQSWGQFVFLGCFVLQLLFIARARG